MFRGKKFSFIVVGILSVMLVLLASCGSTIPMTGALLITNPDEIRQGETMDIRGDGFKPQENVTITCGEDVVTKVTADGNGSFNCSKVVVSRLAVKGIDLVATGDQGTTTSTKIKVTAKQ